jgi:hypothetical protein
MSDPICTSCIAFNEKDDNGALTLPVCPISMCLVCKFYRKEQRCEAFPRRIPQAILIGKVDHRKRYLGDRGVIFLPKEGVSKEELESILGAFDSSA